MGYVVVDIKDIARDALIGLVVRLLVIALEYLGNEMTRVARVIQGYGSDEADEKSSQTLAGAEGSKQNSSPH